jgi:mannose-6-phosphate isomerase-like protein (cupin superfamily)
MSGYASPIEKLTERHNYFRKVLFTGKHAQLVLMCLQPGEEIGNEVHKKVDQFFRVESGKARFVLSNGKEKHLVEAGGAAIVPAGTWHNVINASKKKLKLYTLYSPPNHPKGTVHKTKAAADRAEIAEHRKK